uniref:VWFA domain-containing protein n=1 Tax=Chromera velia CCMP2878 TaxID=1169474 RepID=A0A0G4IFM2_9ALVE|eukprot:Cvel_2491.t1-p1 / transcript=Cvel_2491.t1 / gene=Cvel_2491 / organism=Chromera_velia_CCMP2878 / gene_product=X-ray repair cross-complementing protein 5, putative / transcript_product=X-ray repair cross-complementing protein 5, putative / location=Cvel_scaffold98:19071-21960(-) / protein_length=764 / sequence_SO=supercontig / SO=protein_coding / is_pseudo=false
MAGRQKSCVVVVVDSGSSMKSQFGETGKTRFEIQKEALKLFLQQKLFVAPKEEIGIVCFGASETKNDLAEADMGYDNVVTLRRPSAGDLQMIRGVDALEPSDKEADPLDGIIVAWDLMQKHIGTKNYAKKAMYVFTDGAAQIEGAEDVLPNLVSTMTQQECNLYVVGIEFSSSSSDSSGSAAGGASSPPAEPFFRDFVDKVGGEVLDSAGAFELLRAFKKKEVAQTSKSRVNLTVTPHMQIPVHVFSKVQPQRLPTMEKRSLAAPEDTDGLVRMIRTKYRADDPDGGEVAAEDQAKAFKYGRQLVPVSDADEKMLSAGSFDRCLQTLVAVPASEIPIQIFSGKADCVAAEPANEKAAVAMDSLVRSLQETDRVLIARFVWRANAAPKAVALLPRITSGKAVLMMLPLPFAEDFRSLSFPPLPQPTDAQIAATDALVSTMSLNGGPGEGGPRLDPKSCFNPVIQRFNQAIVARAMDPSAPLPDLDPKIEANLKPERDIAEKAQPAFAAVKAAFTITETEASKRKGARGGKRSWREAALEKAKEIGKVLKSEDVDMIPVDSSSSAGGQMNGASGRGNVRVKEEEGERERVNGAAAASASSASNGRGGANSGSAVVGTANPVKDFQAMLEVENHDLVKSAIEQMSGVIIRLLDESLGDRLHAKALSCLDALRGGCKSEFEALRFNEILRSLKEKCTGGGDALKGFWQSVKARGLTLLSKNDTSRSDVEPEEAARFFEEAQVSAEVGGGAGGAAEEAEEEEDLEGMIE